MFCLLHLRCSIATVINSHHHALQSNRNKVLEMLRCKSNDGLYEGKECMDISFNAANKHRYELCICLCKLLYLICSLF